MLASGACTGAWPELTSLIPDICISLSTCRGDSGRNHEAICMETCANRMDCALEAVPPTGTAITAAPGAAAAAAPVAVSALLRLAAALGRPVLQLGGVFGLPKPPGVVAVLLPGRQALVELFHHLARLHAALSSIFMPRNENAG